MSAQYQRFLRVLEKWPAEKSKLGRYFYLPARKPTWVLAAVLVGLWIVGFIRPILAPVLAWIVDCNYLNLAYSAYIALIVLPVFRTFRL